MYEDLAAETGPLFWLDIAGGEPFLRRDLADIVGLFDAKVVHIPTNGMLGERILETCKQIKKVSSAELVVGISVDGLKHTHNKIRKNKKSWDAV